MQLLQIKEVKKKKNLKLTLMIQKEKIEELKKMKNEINWIILGLI